MQAFDPAKYSSAIAELLIDERVPELGPGRSHRTAFDRLSALSVENAFPQVRDRSMAQACLAGMWLHHDYLDESHHISQELTTSTGSYWHAIMHRREPDASNAKYWWRQVGTHPVIDLLVTEAPRIGYPYQNPFDFVDFCERVRDSGSAEEDVAKRVQLLEWRLLFDWCWDAATDR